MFFIIFCLFSLFGAKKDSVSTKKIDTIFIDSKINKPDRKIYFLNKKAYIKNTKAIDAISNIPFVNSDANHGVFFKGKSIKFLLINGVKASLQKFNAILAQNIRSTEIIHSYIDPKTGEISEAININMKEKPGLIGNLDFTEGLTQEFSYLGGNVITKLNQTQLSIFHTNLWNTTSSEINRLFSNATNQFQENFKIKTNLYQPFYLVSVNHKISDNQSIYQP